LAKHEGGVIQLWGYGDVTQRAGLLAARNNFLTILYSAETRIFHSRIPCREVLPLSKGLSLRNLITEASDDA
jgi:hypothetical protein